ncbi:MAG: isocitrate lyase/phosphoenolpyruvate mutase family protein [Proteobacteria bacterium]|nr:isocitrate lyase/phosphoenolpyruvate mutase family protein [Pseudomonadota bacterium]
MVGDLLHVGHINVLQRARELGDVIVGVLSDEAVASYKRVPFMKLADRLKVVENLAGIGRVLVQNSLSYRENLEALRPNFVVHGDDWRWGEQTLARQEVIDTLRQWDGKLVEVPYTKGISSSSLVGHFAEQGIASRSPSHQLRHTLSVKPFVRIIDAHDAMMARIATEAKAGIQRFDAIWYSCRNDALVRGRSRQGHVDFSSRLAVLGEILEATHLPVIYAGEGFAPDRFEDSTRVLDRLGVAAACFVDAAAGSHSLDLLLSIMRREAVRRNMMAMVEIDGRRAGDADLLRDAGSRCVEAGVEGIVLRVDPLAAVGAGNMLSALRSAGCHVPVLCVVDKDFSVPESELQRAGYGGVVYEHALFDAMADHVRGAAHDILARTMA